MNGASVRVYSRAKDGQTKPYMSNGKRCTNFKVYEFACKDGTDPVFIAPALVTVLQDVRTHYGAPVNVTDHSGYRTPTYNAKPSVGGTAYSQHVYGMAADFHVVGVPPKEVYAYLDKKYPGTYGIGLYKSFVHVDVRKVKSRWNG